jgi:hypothetical protein
LFFKPSQTRWLLGRIPSVLTHLSFDIVFTERVEFVAECLGQVLGPLFVVALAVAMSPHL